jgi:zinc transport system ATP-binding protein
METPIIEMENVAFSFNSHPILENANLSVFENDFMAVIGPNGGGKTTLLKLVLGILKPVGGSVRVFGKEPRKVSHRIGYVPQNIHANKDFPVNVMDVTLMGCLRSGRKFSHYAKKDRAAAEEALDKMEMLPFRNRRIGELSGGQRQRVFIARALAAKPEMMLLDEPTASVDAHGQTELYTLLKELNANTTILVVSHDFVAISSYVKSITCVNLCVHQHDAAEMTREMLDMSYKCPVELIAHGIPHRVLGDHTTRTTRE